MKITPKQYAISLYQTVRYLPKDKLIIVIKNFVKLLIKKNVLKLAPKIIDLFLQYAKRAEGVVDLKVRSVKPLDAGMISKIKKMVQPLLKREIKKIEITEETDPSLIGGVVLKCDDLVFDGSIKKKFEILKNNLTR